MKPKQYSGKLYYDDLIAHVEIIAFIIRESEIGFSLASVTSEHGRWVAESGEPALLQPDGSYLAQNVYASSNGTRASDPWDIVFRIKHKEIGQYIEISGELHEGGEIYEFGGELEAVQG
ncbi:hypothetical protein [Nitrosomonas sp. Is37]|uniref:hypothetical protein n=1 Tax=Nitrosomonas sp. Is37 TaxID=3080535 RepID=UPI00294AB517|nr:hypothetical protein [Nitrosomonas sp. Is37]MDV6345036.1 hypothetical protein [Nitrosomonas sp. Is37]